MAALRISLRRCAQGSLLFLLLGVGGQGLADESAELGKTPTTFDNLEIVDSGLKDRLIIQRVGSDRSDNGLLSVFAGLKNTTGEVLKIEVQTIYRDDIGEALVNGKTSWIGMQLPPHSETTYRSASISGAATDFLIRIRFDKS